jgi:hypothetical protein
MSLPILSAASPTTIPAKVYDRVWVEEISIKGPDPNSEVSGEVKLHKYGMFDGVAELEPDGGQWIRMDKMLEESATDSDLAAAMGALIAYVNKLGQENDIISS